MTMTGAGVAAALLAAGLLLAGCAITPYADETDSMGKAAAAFKSQATGPSPIPAARATLAKAVLLRGLVQGSPPPLTVTCGQTVGEWNRGVATDVGAAVGGPGADPTAMSAAYKAIDGDFKALGQIAPCGLLQGAPAMRPPTPAVVKAMDDYFDGLQAIVGAKDSDEVVAASQTLSKSLSGLAKAAKAPAAVQAAPGFLAKLAKMALAEAQYAAVRHFVLEADLLFDPAAPALTSALRLQQGYWAAEVAQAATTGMVTLNATLNDPALARDPALKLTVWDRAGPILDEFVKEQADSRADPAPAVRALAEAHHKLAAAIRSGRGQASLILNNAADLAISAKALAGS